MKGQVICCVSKLDLKLNQLKITLDMDKVNYMNKIQPTLDAVLGMN
jgi:hypothetical protein